MYVGGGILGTLLTFGISECYSTLLRTRLHTGEFNDRCLPQSKK